MPGVYVRSAASPTSSLSRKNAIALGFGTLVTGASVSPDGATVVLRTYGSVLVFPRPAGHPLHAAFGSSSCTGASAAEPQGEAIAITPDGGGYLTISEGATQPIYSFDV